MGTTQLFFSALIHVFVILMSFRENPSNDMNPNLGWLFQELNFLSLKTQAEWMKSLLNLYRDRRIVCFVFYCIMFCCSRRSHCLVLVVFSIHSLWFFAGRSITEPSLKLQCYRHDSVIAVGLTWRTWRSAILLHL